MANAEIRKNLEVNKDRLFDTIVDYEKYSEFVDGVTSVKILERNGPKSKIEYSLDMMGKAFTYTLEHTEDRANGKISWQLLESDFFKVNSGTWHLVAVGEDETDTTYSLDVEFKISIPGFILNRLVKGSLPSLLKNFEQRTKQL